MDPEDPPRQRHPRLFPGSRGRYHPAADARLRELHLPAILVDGRQLPARADRRYLQSLHRARHPVRGREHAGDPFRQAQRHRLPVPAVDAEGQLHEPRQYHRLPRRQDGPGDAAHLHADDPSGAGSQEEGVLSPHNSIQFREIAMTATPRTVAAGEVCDRRRLANALRILAIDAVEQARSGHPGMPMGMADIAEALWNHHLRHNPADPGWPDRDRFVLSNGHGSMLLYGLLHLTGYDLPMDELKRFRQLYSRTPGHPEHGVTPGVETT